jgi:hypothetical protein
MLEGWLSRVETTQRYGTMSDRHTDPTCRSSSLESKSHVLLTTRSHRADMIVRLALLPARMCDPKGRERCGGGGDEEDEEKNEDEGRKEGEGREGGGGGGAMTVASMWAVAEGWVNRSSFSQSQSRL